MKHRFLRLLPPQRFTVLAVVLYLLTEGPDWVFGIHLLGDGGNPLLLIFAVFYGIYRVVYFHPIYRPSYRQWLEQTPWTPAKPLPLGPVHPVWEDGVVVLILAGLAYLDPGYHPVTPVLVTGLAYVLPVMLALYLTNRDRFLFLLLFGLAGLGLLWESLWGLFLAALVLCAAACWGSHRSLREFPWNTERFDALKRSLFQAGTQRLDNLGLLTPVVPVPPKALASRENGFLVSLLIGWCLCVLLLAISFEDELSRGVAGCSLHIMLCFGAIATRIVIYKKTCRAPISLWGRLVTFRWIIPRHDVLYVAPICMLAVSFAGISVLTRFPPVVATIMTPVLTFIVFLILFNMGPSRDTWELTGQHRLFEPYKSVLYRNVLHASRKLMQPRPMRRG